MIRYRYHFRWSVLGFYFLMVGLGHITARASHLSTAPELGIIVLYLMVAWAWVRR